MAEAYDIPVLDLYLDTENPRHKPIDDQEEIIRHLVSTESIKALAKDIAENGLSPIELFAVIETDGSYVVVEGNRRLCALTLLNDPEFAPKADVPYFRRLAESSELIPKEVICMVFASREEADVWIERRHEGEMEGVGTRRWKPDQIARHRARQNRKDQNALAHQIIEYAKQYTNVSEEIDERQILTTATRYLGNPFFRKTIGVVSAKADSNVVINVSYADFEIVIERFLADLLDVGSSEGSRADKKKIEEYARQLMRDGYAPDEHGEPLLLSDRQFFKPEPGPGPSSTGAPDGENGEDSAGTDSNGGQGPSETPSEGDGTDESASDEGNGGSNGSSKPGVRGSVNPDKRKYMLPVDFKLHTSDKTLSRLYKELKQVPAEDNPLAVALLTRALLETIYIRYVENVLGKTVGDHTKLQAVLGWVVDDLSTKKEGFSKELKRALGALKRTQSSESNALSAKTLGAFAHAASYPNHKELKREWDNIQPIIIHILECL